jgi:hypothetical protein
MDSVARECRDTSIGKKVIECTREGTEDQRYNEIFSTNKVDDCNY